MTEKGFITANSGDTEVAGTLSIAAPRALYAVASGHKPKKNPEELLPASPADRGSGIRLIKSEDRKKDDITNRPARSTYPKKKSVLTSGATPVVSSSGARGLSLPHNVLGLSGRGFTAAKEYFCISRVGWLLRDKLRFIKGSCRKALGALRKRNSFASEWGEICVHELRAWCRCDQHFGSRDQQFVASTRGQRH